jgi:geranylgeranyl pyrophosphate synthase
MSDVTVSAVDLTASLAVSEPDEALTLRRLKSLGELIERQLLQDWSADSQLANVCRYAVSAPGKFFRPILLLESALAVGGDAYQVLPAAAGTEGAHVASLMHDDIIDGDQMRRGLPAVHVVFGRDDTIVGGDALIFYLFGALANCADRGVESSRIVMAMNRAAEAGHDLCRGQMLEEAIRSDYDCKLDSYLEMIELKTGALFRASCFIGATLGGGSELAAAALARYGTCLGIAFQIRDDLLPYLSSDEEAGKSRMSDLANRRMTLPFLLCREQAGEQVAELDALMTGQDDLQGRYERLSYLLNASGSITRAVEMASRYAAEAIDALSILPDSESKTSLCYFARAAADRSR